MNRAPFIFACSTLSDATAALPIGSLLGIEATHQHMLALPHGECLLQQLGAAVILDGIAGKWELWLALPHNCAVGEDFDSIGPKTQRAVQRARIASPAFRGPWSLAQFCALFPVATKAVPLLHDDAGRLQSPLVFDGDYPYICGAADYRPSDADAASDKTTDCAKLYADALVAATAESMRSRDH
jgi:hypothetical protein